VWRRRGACGAGAQAAEGGGASGILDAPAAVLAGSLEDLFPGG
jgi:hypothetical protein